MAYRSHQAESSRFRSCSPISWNVLLSFRGEDTRRNFTGHLHTALSQAGIRTFMTDSERQSGEAIPSALSRAMQESKVFIVIFSTNYAGSKWCLTELVKILECKRTTGQLVLPVFYKVDPMDVREQAGSFADSCVNNKEHLVDHMAEVEKWRAALNEAANLSGYHLDANGYEDKLVQRIVEKVLLELRPKHLNVAKHPVGLESRVKALTTLLSLGTDDVLMVGIFGMGGIGKSTLAKAIYNETYRCFEGYCFLPNVREVSKQPNGLIRLQEQILSDVLNITSQVSSVERGIHLMEERFRCKKVLIVLDDMDEVIQLDSLAGERNWFAPRSRIIITTRDVRLLDQVQVNVRYEVKELDDNESLELFKQHAFRDTIPLEDHKDLLKKIVKYAGGLPLALEVLGSYLFTRNIMEWRSSFDKLKLIPHHKIQEKLMISFDALDDDHLKDMFLDIACFFIGMDKDEATTILNASGYFSENEISILKERCLLTIDKTNQLGMHVLLRDMGREIVRKESTKEPGKRSRLWCIEDITDVLKKHKGTEAIEAIFPKNTVKWVFEPLSLSTRTFERMHKLRLLRLGNTHLTGSFEHLFEELRWLCWKYCPLEYFPSDLNAEKLVSLDLSSSQLKLLWTGIKLMGNLRALKLNWSHKLVATPNFAGVPMLEKLELNWCSSLTEIHPSIGLLDKLVYLDLALCSNLKTLPSTICNLRSLEELKLDDCKGLEKLPEELGKMESLRKLCAAGTGIHDIPESIGFLSKLVDLNLERCGKLKSLPHNICNLRALEHINIQWSSNFVELPEHFGNIECLRELLLAQTAIEKLPNSIGHMKKLVELDLGDCNLKNLPTSICNIKSLESLSLTGCSELEGLPEEVGDMESLKEIFAIDTSFTHLPDSIGLLTNLKSLYVGVTDEFEIDNLLPSVCVKGFLPPSISGLTSLESLSLRNRSLLDKDIPVEIGSLPSLTDLDLGGNKFYSLPNSLSQLINLKLLNVGDCTNLLSLPELPPSLEALHTFECTSLQKLPNLSNLSNLEYLNLRNSTSLEKLQGLENLNSLNKIDARGCIDLKMNFLSSLIQKYCEFGTTSDIYLARQDVPDGFTLQSTRSSLNFEIPLNKSGIFTGMAIWAGYDDSRREGWEDPPHKTIWAAIKNKTNGTEWTCLQRVITLDAHSWVHTVPKAGLAADSGDKIEVVFRGYQYMKVERCAVCLIYTPAAGVTDADVAETSRSYKRMKMC